MGGHGRGRWRASAITVVMVATVAAANGASATARADASGPPAILSASVGVTEPTQAVVSLSVDPNGLPTNVVVQYGTSSALGETTPPSSPGTLAPTPTPFSVTINGLEPATTYRARVVATNSAGSATSGLLSFATPASSTSPTSPGPGASTGTIRVVPVASPGAWGGLSGVACIAGTCLAVGYQGRGSGPSRPLVERWTGSSWVDFPAPATVGASLYALACPASDDCLAVGRDGSNVYAAQLVGRSWRVLPAPSPPTPNGDILRSVSCVSTRNCWAAGYTDGATRAMRGLLEHWNGQTWSVVVGATAPDSMLNGVSCVTAGCWAVGGANAFPQLGQLFVEHLVGSTWVRTGPTGSGVANSVSCSADAGCWLTAGESRSTALLQLRGAAWRVTADPGAQSGVGPVSVACVSTASCWAGGYGGALHWNGVAWDATTPAFLRNVVLLDVACPSQVCLAVGTRVNGSPQSSTPTAAVLRTP